MMGKLTAKKWTRALVNERNRGGRPADALTEVFAYIESFAFDNKVTSDSDQLVDSELKASWLDSLKKAVIDTKLG